MTKPVVATGLMMLFEQGKFSLSDPLSHYLPEFANLQVMSATVQENPQKDLSTNITALKKPITILDLLRHSAGFTLAAEKQGPVEALYLNAELDNCRSLAEFSASVAKLPLVFQPSEQWRYSVASDIQGRLIEVLSGKSLAVFLQDNIFAPLGMVDTHFTLPKNKYARLSELYHYQATAPLTPYVGNDYIVPEQPPFYPSGGIGLVASTLDYWRFAQMLANKGEFQGQRLLQPSTVKLMTQNQLPLHINSIW